MKTIVITTPDYWKGELQAICRLFDEGLEILHVRKPASTAEAYKAFLQSIPSAYHSRIVLHEYFELADELHLKGIHLNRRHPQAPDGYAGSVSRSCHSLDEIKRYKDSCEYLFLSPIFDSISKQGYESAFTPDMLAQAARQGIVDRKVIALGGVTRACLPQLEQLGFGGAALLGDAWKDFAGAPLPGPTPAIVLSIAGSDCSGGAGIQADIKAISANGGYAASVITAITAQNTQGVQGIHAIPPSMVQMQIESVLADLRVDAIKIGMVFEADIVRAIAQALRNDFVRTGRNIPVVFDPVMISTSGHKLMSDDTIEALRHELFPLSTLLTPNLHEASMLAEREIKTVEQMEETGRALSGRYHTSVLIKGGHLEGDEMCDVLVHRGDIYHYPHTRVDSKNLHGTGCTLSSAIATHIAKGDAMPQAVEQSAAYVHRAICQAARMKIGQGNGPLWHFV